MGLFGKLRSFFAGGSPGNGASASRDADGGIPCREAMERLFEYLDGELDGVTEEEVAAHFRVCERCYPRLKFERAFQKAMQRVRAGEEPPESVRRKVLQVLESEGFERP